MSLCLRVFNETVLLGTHNLCFDLKIISISYYYSYLGDGEAIVAWSIKYHSLHNKRNLYTRCNYIKMRYFWYF